MVKKAKEKDKKAVKKVKEKVDKRDNKGRFKKGTGGGPGRKKGEPKDIICKDGKKRSTEQLIEDLLTTYSKLGSDKFLHKWALKSQRNLARFIDILFKFAPEPKRVDGVGDVSYQLSDKFMPKFTIERIITDERPDEHGGPKMKMPRPGDIIDKKVKEMEDKLREKDAEIQRLRGIFETHGIDSEELVHEPIKPIELPEHSETEIEEKIEELEKRKAELEHELEEKGK